MEPNEPIATTGAATGPRVIDMEGNDLKGAGVPAAPDLVELPPRFVVPDTRRISISRGDWIECKQRLTYGEQQRLKSAGLTSMRAGEDGKSAEIATDFAVFDMAKIQVWVVAWSFRNKRGLPIDVTRDTIENLDPETAEEILEVLNEHADAVEAEKKARNAANRPLLT